METLIRQGQVENLSGEAATKRVELRVPDSTKSLEDSDLDVDADHNKTNRQKRPFSVNVEVFWDELADPKTAEGNLSHQKRIGLRDIPPRYAGNIVKAEGRKREGEPFGHQSIWDSMSSLLFFMSLVRVTRIEDFYLEGGYIRQTISKVGWVICLLPDRYFDRYQLCQMIKCQLGNILFMIKYKSIDKKGKSMETSIVAE